jgi:1-acyl-sn-glycerol-3-phosphate acyltransferase
VANHPTLLDVVAIIAHVDDVCCVVKRPLMANPLVGPLLRACGHITVDGEDMMDGARVVDAAAQRLAEGQRVLIFPEGTRSPPGAVRSFRRGAFELARRAGVPVVPAFLRCDPPALGKEGTVRNYPKARPVLRVRVLPPMGQISSSREACQDVMTAFEHRIRQPAPHTS